MSALLAPEAPTLLSCEVHSPSDGQALEIEVGHAAGHEIGDDPRGAAGHRPAHVAVATVEEEITMAGESQDRRPFRRHGPQTRAVLPAVVVGGVRKQVAREA